MKGKNNNPNKNNPIDFTQRKEVGNLGEEIACTFLRRKNFHILERNYLKKWGEIDIVALKDNILTFIEVKSVVENYSGSYTAKQDPRQGGFRPEENVHIQKRRRIRRTIQTYMAQVGCGPNQAFLFHIAVVRMNIRSRRARVSCIENVIL